MKTFTTITAILNYLVSKGFDLNPIDERKEIEYILKHGLTFCGDEIIYHDEHSLLEIN